MVENTSSEKTKPSTAQILAITFLGYILFSVVLFEPVFRTLFYMTTDSRVRLHASILFPSVAIGFLVGMNVFVLLRMKFLSKLRDWGLRPLIVLVSTWTSAFFAASSIADIHRDEAIIRLKPDKVMINSFRQSLRKTPKEYQFFLHAGAIKDCKAYAWSYSELEFYELNDNTSPNVLPYEWIKECSIMFDFKKKEVTKRAE